VRELGDRAQLARALNNYGIVLSDMGDYAAACATYRESLDIRRELGDRAAIAQSLTNLGTDTAHLGDYAQARTYQQEALDIFRELDEAWSMAISLRGLASIAHEQQAYAEARAHLEECLAISIRLRVPAQIATCLIGLGGLAAAQHAPRRAAQLFGAAERLRETLGTPVPVEELRWYDAYVADARGKLDAESFAAAWAEGRRWSTELAIEHALRDVDGEASQSARDDPLSAREREVAMLIARGMTNQQIADELVIARSTVERHVVHILDKLTLTGRTQIAVWAATHPQTYGLTLDPQV